MIGNRIRAISCVSTLLLLIVPIWAGAQDMMKMCTGCHGEDGLGTDSDIPIIAGMSAIVQEDALFAYVDGARNCVSKPMMCKTASRLTEEQIIEFAAHFSELPYKAAGEEFDATLAAAGQKIHKSLCAICHGADGPGDSEDDMDAGILHGQRKDYVRYALQQYVAGDREQSPAMKKKISQLSADDVEALVNYYASYRD